MSDLRPPTLSSAPAAGSASLGQFEILAAVARREAGLMIPRQKAPMVFSRLTKRLRALGLGDFSAYCRLIESDDGAAERRQLVSTLTTNVTAFFREAHHFETLARDVMPELVARAKSGRPVRLWSAGCSSGPEPYSIAMVILEHLPDAGSHDLRILATDINSGVLRTAQAGIFDERQMEPISPERRRSFFEPAAAGPAAAPQYRLRDRVRALVAFRELNLIGPWPMRGQFDAIFCRNVVIYFDKQTQATLWPRFHDACRTGGYLFLGHSERLDDTHCGEFRPCGTTTYRRLPASRK